MTATQNTESVRNVILLKRSTLNTGGTIVTPTTVKLDGLNANATASCYYYTANPTTLGTLVGGLYCRKFYISETTKVQSLDEFIYPLNDASQQLTLRGADEMIAINFAGVTSAGNSICCTILWSEE